MPQKGRRKADKYHPRAVSDSGMERVAFHEEALLESERFGMEIIRRARDQGLCSLAEILRRVLPRYGPAPERSHHRPHRQRRKLHASELPLGHGEATGEQLPSSQAPRVKSP